MCVQVIRLKKDQKENATARANKVLPSSEYLVFTNTYIPTMRAIIAVGI